MAVSDSAARDVDLRETRGATLGRRITATHLGDLSGYSPFVRVDGALVDVVTSGNYFDFSIPTSELRNGVAYEIGWLDPAGRTRILCSGRILLT